MTHTPADAARAYSDPYAAGVALGLVLLAAYAFAGHGLGAAGAFAGVVAAATAAVVGPQQAAAMPVLALYLPSGVTSPLHDWFFYELLGAMLGGATSAWFAGRLRLSVDRGPLIAARTRLLTALGGGVVMGAGAKFARGCTSGQALTGGALLSVGSWVFILSCFAAAYAFAPVVRRLWR